MSKLIGKTSKIGPKNVKIDRKNVKVPKNVKIDRKNGKNRSKKHQK